VAVVAGVVIGILAATGAFGAAQSTAHIDITQ
jgi:hypothetical protein